MYERIGWSATKALKVSPVLAPLPWPARLVATVHDSVLVECPLDKREEVIACLHKAMEQPWAELGGYSIPCEVKYGMPGASWAELDQHE